MAKKYFTTRLHAQQRCYIAHILVAALLSMSNIAFAKVPFTKDAIKVNIIDSVSRKKIPGAIVLATQSYYWTGFHSSGTTCFRAAALTLNSSDKPESIMLPSIGVADLIKITNTRHIELAAYREGYCGAKPHASAQHAGFIKYAAKNDPSGMWGTVDSPAPGSEVTINLVPANDPAEHRLKHLSLVARFFAKKCPNNSLVYLDPFKKAILAEARQLAVTQSEKIQLVRIEEVFEPEKRKTTLRLLVHGAASSGDVEILSKYIRWAKQDPTFTKPFCESAGDVRAVSCISIAHNADDIARTHAFTIDERNEKGNTPLMEAVYNMQYGATEFLLQQGADVNALSGYGGYSAIDLVLSKARDDIKETGTDGQAIQLLLMIDQLVSHHPAPTLHARYYNDLTDLEKWKLSPNAYDFWLKVQQKTKRLMPRNAIVLTCPIEQVARQSLR